MQGFWQNYAAIVPWNICSAVKSCNLTLCTAFLCQANQCKSIGSPERERGKTKTVGGDRGGIGSPVGCKNLQTSILSSQKGGSLLRVWEQGGGLPDPHPSQSPPHPATSSACPETERGLCQKEVELGALVLDRPGEGGCRGGLGLCWGWSHTCTATPLSRWSAAGTGPAMRTPLARSGLCAPSNPPRRWGTASSPRPSPTPGQRDACANVYFLCQKFIRGRTLSGHPNRCLDQLPKTHQGNHILSRMIKVQTRVC